MGKPATNVSSASPPLSVNRIDLFAIIMIKAQSVIFTGFALSGRRSRTCRLSFISHRPNFITKMTSLKVVVILLGITSLALALDNGLAQTPQMAWNSWNKYDNFA